MDLCPAQLQLQGNMFLPEYNQLQHWRYPDSEGYSSLSPTSSIDSFSFSPSHPSCAFSDSSFQTVLPLSENLQNNKKQLPAKKGYKMRNRIVSNQRQSASEREKMRMRNLSTALQNLRQYLPAAVAPVGKTLTKSEILRLTIRYISHLSDVLGLDDEILEKRREERLRRSRCPVGLNCCQGEMHEFCSMNAPLPQAVSYCTTSPQLCPEPTRNASMDTDYFFPAMPSPQFSDHGLPEDTFSPCVLSSTPVHTTSDLKEDFTAHPPISPDLGFCQDMIDDMWDALENKEQWATIQNHESIQIQDLC